jgi:hypothetical protein
MPERLFDAAGGGLSAETFEKLVLMYWLMMNGYQMVLDVGLDSSRKAFGQQWKSTDTMMMGSSLYGSESAAE